MIFYFPSSSTVGGAAAAAAGKPAAKGGKTKIKLAGYPKKVILFLSIFVFLSYFSLLLLFGFSNFHLVPFF